MARGRGWRRCYRTSRAASPGGDDERVIISIIHGHQSGGRGAALRRTPQDLVQPRYALGRQGRPGWRVRNARRGGRTAGGSSARQLAGQDATPCERRERGSTPRPSAARGGGWPNDENSRPDPCNGPASALRADRRSDGRPTIARSLRLRAASSAGRNSSTSTTSCNRTSASAAAERLLSRSSVLKNPRCPVIPATPAVTGIWTHTNPPHPRVFRRVHLA
jgi:hypothetical protein